MTPGCPRLGQRDRRGGFRRFDGSLLKAMASEKAPQHHKRRHGVRKGVTASEKPSWRLSPIGCPFFPPPGPSPAAQAPLVTVLLRVTQSHSRCLQEHRDHLLRNMALRSCRPLSLQDLPRLLFPKSDSGTLDQMVRCCFLNFILTPGPQTIRAPFR